MFRLISARDYTGFEVLTELGVRLGYVKEIKIGRPGQFWILISISKRLWLPDTLVSTYQLNGVEVIEEQPHRFIVLKEAEYRLEQQTVGLLQRFRLWQPDFEVKLHEVNQVAEVLRVMQKADKEMEQALTGDDVGDIWDEYMWELQSRLDERLDEFRRYDPDPWTDEWHDDLNEDEGDAGAACPKKPYGPTPPPFSAEADLPED